MDANEKSCKVKTHILFLSLLLLAYLCELGLNLRGGRGIKAALLNSVLALRPMEVILFIALWYTTATGNWKDGLKSNLTTLNLKEK